MVLEDCLKKGDKATSEKKEPIIDTRVSDIKRNLGCGLS